MSYVSKLIRTVKQNIETRSNPHSAQSTFPAPSQMGRVMLGCPERKGVQQYFLGNQK